MLVQKIKIDSASLYDNIEFDDFYLSPDLDFVSGTTSSRYGLVTGSMVRYQSNSGTLFYESPLECTNAVRQGHVVYTGLFPITRTTYYDKQVVYVEYQGKVYYVNDGDLVIDSEDWDYIVSGITDSDEDVAIPVKAYIENGTVDIDGNVLSVDVLSGPFSGLSSDEGSPMFKYNYLSEDVSEYNGEPFEISLLAQSDWKVVTKFVLRPDDNILLDVPSKHIIRDSAYIRIGTNTYTLRTDDEMSLSGAVYTTVGEHRIDIEDITACNGVINFNETVIQRAYAKLWDGSTVKIEVYNEEADSGDKIAIVMSNAYDSIPVGSTVIARSLYSDYTIVPVETDKESGKEYVVFNNAKYDLVKDGFVTVTINGKEYEFIYINDQLSSGVIEIGEHVVPLRINGDKATRFTSSRIDIGGEEYYDTEHVSYDIKRYDLVEIEGTKYKVDRTNSSTGSVTLTSQKNYEFNVISVSGTGVYYLEPIMATNDLSDIYTEKRRIDICAEVGSRENNFVFYLKNSAFGNEKITFKKVFDQQMRENPDMMPISSDDVVSPDSEGAYQAYSENIADTFKLYKIIDYYSVPLPLSTRYGANLMQEDILIRGHIGEKFENSINPIVDMEKDVYFPMHMTDDGKFQAVDRMEFNIHLRTRDIDSWKVNENDDNPFFSNDSNWNVTDCGPYRQWIDEHSDEDEELYKLMRSSDLLHFLKFKDSDVERQKKRIEKTFIRLSFYNSPDAANQYLLGTSTIFLNEGKLYWKYSSNQANGSFVDVNVGYNTDTIGVATEPMVGGVLSFDDEKRLSSRFSVVDKNKTDDSSEGYYIYMFKEYSSGLRTQTIYMTVDLYHAGLGKKIPLYLPMKLDLSRPLTFSQEDLQVLKAGIPLERYYDQLYIPLDCKYDFDSKKYIYWLRNNYITDKEHFDGTMVFNLFELKIGQ